MRKLVKAVKIAACLSLAAFCFLLLVRPALSQTHPPDESKVQHFQQLRSELRSPNLYRSASGAPGPAYWQQQVNYEIDVTLDENKKRLLASTTITYTNNSPDRLNYLWLALDQNRFRDNSLSRLSEITSRFSKKESSGGSDDQFSYHALRRHQAYQDRSYGFEIQSVTKSLGRKLDYVINDTMMRINLPEPLDTSETLTFTIKWEHNILDEEAIGGRGGYEYFKEDDNYIFAIAQWFPRLAAYTDYTGWQNKQFIRRGEFTLEFGDYDVRITVPRDHIVSATGELQNPKNVLTAAQQRRLKSLKEDEVTFIVTPEEAAKNEERKARGLKTWHFKAENVRDFAWASSRKFIWDGMLFKQDDDTHPTVLAMSFYPKEAEPIWSRYSTHAVVHTMDVYNRFAFNYPYPTSQSVNGWKSSGMEYPMITFNGYRPSKDEASGETVYSRRIKYALIGVIIHEIGHIYFPMVVNSDERRWTWMDEGINTFLEYMAEYEWEENYPIRGNMQNPLDEITRYMTSSNQVPIMTQSDSILQFGSNAYAKPAAALIVLRETVMGRELFDPAFREYAQRWKFKRPTPEDFFRTMEDASAVDLDWFWRGWFFGTDHVDMAITDVREYTISTQNPEINKPQDRINDLKARPENIVQRRNREAGMKTRIERFDSLKDLYNENDKFTITNKDRNKFKSFMDGLDDWERKAYERAMDDGDHLYFIDFQNIGGLISPLPLSLTYADGSTEKLMLPAEIWRQSNVFVTKLLIRNKRITSIYLDKEHQTADSNYSDNAFPPLSEPSRLELYKYRRSDKNLMADMLVKLKEDDSATKDDEKVVPINPKTPEPRPPLAPQDQRALERTLDKLLER